MNITPLAILCCVSWSLSFLFVLSLCKAAARTDRAMDGEG
jgi:hypothetical protein